MSRSFQVSLALADAVLLATGVIAWPQCGRSLGAELAAASNDTVPRTPWGDSDLHRTFTSDDSFNVPPQRPEEYGERLFLTPNEYGQRVAPQTARAESLFGEVFQPEDARIGINPPGHWLDVGDEFSRQISLVIDPPNGRIPEMTPRRKRTTRIGGVQRGFGGFLGRVHPLHPGHHARRDGLDMALDLRQRHPYHPAIRTWASRTRWFMKPG